MNTKTDVKSNNKCEKSFDFEEFKKEQEAQNFIETLFNELFYKKLIEECHQNPEVADKVLYDIFGKNNPKAGLFPFKSVMGKIMKIFEANQELDQNAKILTVITSNTNKGIESYKVSISEKSMNEILEVIEESEIYFTMFKGFNKTNLEKTIDSFCVSEDIKDRARFVARFFAASDFPHQRNLIYVVFKWYRSKDVINPVFYLNVSLPDEVRSLDLKPMKEMLKEAEVENGRPDCFVAYDNKGRRKTKTKGVLFESINTSKKSALKNISFGTLKDISAYIIFGDEEIHTMKLLKKSITNFLDKSSYKEIAVLSRKS